MGDQLVIVVQGHETARRAAQVMVRTAAKSEFELRPEVRRWKPWRPVSIDGDVAWDDLPDPDACQYEVSIKLPFEAGERVAALARDRGYLAISVDRWVRIAVPSRPASDEAAKWLQAAAGNTVYSKPKLRNMRWFRRWLWREWTRGNYATGVSMQGPPSI